MHETSCGDALTRLRLTRRARRLSATALVLAVIFTCFYYRGSSLRTTYENLYHDEIPQNYPHSTKSGFTPASLDPKDKTADELCKTFPKGMLNLVQPVLKIGYGDSVDKLDAQLDSVCACFNDEDLLVFSDMDEEIRGHHAVDVLADLPDSYFNITAHPAMKNYVKQKELRTRGRLTKASVKAAGVKGWDIDKYKFLPMIQRAWHAKPDKPFYFFFETDTYVFWDSAFRFFQTFDPDDPLYIGSPTYGRHDEVRDYRTSFANGGPGFVLSRGAIRALLDRKPDALAELPLRPHVIDAWEELLRSDCCGDSVVGWALWNSKQNVELKGYWPLFNPHPLHGIPFSTNQWCQPVITLHKTKPQDMRSLWKWEFSQRQLDRPITYRDLWHFQHEQLTATRTDWDNGDWDRIPIEGKGPRDVEECEKACDKNPQCLQYNWRGRDERQCILVKSMRYGEARKPEVLPPPPKKEGEKEGWLEKVTPKAKKHTDFTSGWMLSRVAHWRDKHTCDLVQWVAPSLERIY